MVVICGLAIFVDHIKPVLDCLIERVELGVCLKQSSWRSLLLLDAFKIILVFSGEEHYVFYHLFDIVFVADTVVQVNHGAVKFLKSGIKVLVEMEFPF